MEQIIDNDHNITTLGNVIVMDVEELHTSWKTYHINVTTDMPGDLRLIIRLKAKDPNQRQSNNNEDDSENILFDRPQSISSEDNTLIKEPQSSNLEDILDADITMVEQPEQIHLRKASLRPHKVIAKPVRLLHFRSESCTTKAIKAQNPLKVHAKNKNKDLNVPLIVDPSQFPPPMSPLVVFHTPPADDGFRAAVAAHEKNM
ncbi:hypothetical protein BDN67DRAFT_1017913 [Paxillus ammoniavirescens]|nr:hypothetical protein BDN67DRAFT_1017913 [Paxillus ammoniavirescens]